jgi:hypothetical protein
MLSPFVIGPVERAQSLQERWVGDAREDAARNRSAALVEISIDFAGRSHAAFGCRPEAAAHLLDFLASQITSASASQHSVLIIHVFSPFIIGPVEQAHLFKRNFTGGRATDENADRCRGRPAMKLALADRGVAVSLAENIDRAECGGT